MPARTFVFHLQGEHDQKDHGRRGGAKEITSESLNEIYSGKLDVTMPSGTVETFTVQADVYEPEDRSRAMRRGDKFMIQGVILNDKDRIAGQFTRVIEADGSVRNVNLDVDERFQGLGIGTAFLDRTEADLVDAGATQFKVHAAGDVGRMAWASRGYRIDPEDDVEHLTSRWLDGSASSGIQARWPEGDPRHEQIAALRSSWEDDREAVYPGDLIVIDRDFRGPLLSGPSWYGIKDVPGRREEDLAVEVFHLQGQHDQQSHAGGRAKHGGDRTGYPEVDAVIEAFLDEPLGDWTTDDTKIGDMNATQCAGSCDSVAEQFTEFGKARGLRVYTTQTDVSEMGYEITGDPAGQIMDDDGNIVDGFYQTHTVNQVYVDGQGWPLTIDFTARQYGYDTPVKTDPAVREEDLAAEVFHLQGQHDQKDHGNRAGAKATGIPAPSEADIERRARTRDVPFQPHEAAGFTSKRPVFQNTGRWFLVHAADGTAIRVAGGRQTPVQAKLDMVNALADAYDANPITAVDRWGEKAEPRIEILDEWDQTPETIAYVMPGLDPAKFDIHSSIGRMHGGQRPYDIFVNDNQDVWTEDALVNFRAAAMPELANHSPRTYVITHEYGHVRAAVGDDPRAEVKRIGGAIANRGWMGMSTYGQTNQAESHAEAFAEWTLSGGKTTNQAARLYARDLRWPGAPAFSERIEEPLAASAGFPGMDEYMREPLVCIDGPNGPEYVFEQAPTIETFHLQGQHDQQSHAGGRARTPDITDYDMVRDAFSAAFTTKNGLEVRSEIDSIREGWDGEMTDVEGTIYAEHSITGEMLKAGEFRRTLYPDGEIYNDELYVTPTQTGQGIGTAFLDYSERQLAEAGFHTINVDAVDIGQYAWAARGYRLQDFEVQSGTHRQWLELAQVQNTELGGKYTAEIDALARAWDEPGAEVYGADLVALDPAFSSVFLEGPSWTGTRSITAMRDEELAVEVFHLKGQHDQQSHAGGRARASYERSAEVLIEDPLAALSGDDKVSVSDPALRAAAKFNGPIAVADQMTPSERRMVEAGLGTFGGDDEFLYTLVEARSAGRLAEGIGLEPNKYKNIPLGPVFQAAHVAVYIEALKESDLRLSESEMLKARSIIDEFHMGTEGTNGYGPDFDDAVANMTYELESTFGVSPAAGFIGALNRSWTESSQGHLSQAHQIAIANVRGYEFAADGTPESMDWLYSHPEYPQGLKNARQLYSDWQPAFDASALATYRYTQSKLPDGPVSLYRGVRGMAAVNTESGDYAVEINPLSSWSASPDTAYEFGDYVFEVQVPSEMIYSTSAISGLGSLPEWEAIVTADDMLAARLVNRDPMTDEVVSLDDMYEQIGMATEDRTVVRVDELDPDWLRHARSSTVEVFHLKGQHNQKDHGNRGGASGRSALDPSDIPVYSDEYGELVIESTGVDRIRQIAYDYDGGSDVFDVVIVENDDGTISVDAENLYGSTGTIEGERALEKYLNDNDIDVRWDGERGTLHATHRAAVMAGEGTEVQKLIVGVETAYSGTFQAKNGAEFTIGETRMYIREAPPIMGEDNASVEVRGSIMNADGDEVGTFSRAVYEDGVVYNHSLNIDREYQGQGIGSAFLDKTEAALGASEYRLSAVNIGKYAWAARGYKLDTKGNWDLAALNRDRWIEDARRYASEAVFTDTERVAAESVLRSWTDDLDAVYPGDLLAVSPKFRGVFLEGPSWDAVRTVDDALTAAAGIEVFHLQGQHDQKTHGNRGAGSPIEDLVGGSDGYSPKHQGYFGEITFGRYHGTEDSGVYSVTVAEHGTSSGWENDKYDVEITTDEDGNMIGAEVTRRVTRNDIGNPEMAADDLNTLFEEYGVNLEWGEAVVDGRRVQTGAEQDEIRAQEAREDARAAAYDTIYDAYSFDITDKNGESYYVEAEVTVDSPSGGSVSGWILNEASAETVGTFQRDIDLEYGRVDNGSFDVKPEYQGRGIGTAFLDRSEAVLAEAGIERARLTAVDVGRYAWMARGYQVSNADRESVVRQWVPEVESILASRDFTDVQRSQAQAVMRSWQAGDDVYGADLLSVSDEFRDVFLDGPTYSASKALRPDARDPVWVDPNQLEFDLAADLQVFHLQGQHDQSTHAGGRSKASKEPKAPEGATVVEDDAWAEREGNERLSGEGDCYPTANLLVWDKVSTPEADNWRAVHGVVTGQGELEGVRFGHAWAEETQRFPVPESVMQSGSPEQIAAWENMTFTIVHDKSNGNDISMPAEMYYKIGDIDQRTVQRYTPAEVGRKMVESGHHGPWEDEE